ncbi:MAG TPA: AAA family ATPase, partial [Pseudonocardiaceae bacterium]|nr:AAA family ATPase [Pseudonocardiaceae bacterium]
LREQAYQRLMRLHAARGERARAVGVYHVCAATLDRELGVAPSAATRAVYQGLLPREPAGPIGPGGGRVDPPLVGRAPQWARLAAAWRATDAGQARFVLVSGEPGVGKTRLAEDFRAWCARRGAVTAHARCYPAEGPLPYSPVVSWLRCEPLRSRLSRLDDRRLGGPRLAEIARLLPELLVEMPELEPPAPLPESEQRHRLFDAVSAALLPAAGPTLLVLDDLQHGDRETCQLLHYLLRVAPHTRVVIMATARREEIDGDHPVCELFTGLDAQERFGEIELTRLDRVETAELAERLTGAPLAESDARELFADTEGNPLFVVEALRAGWSAGRLLSPRVRVVIEARLAQLGASAPGSGRGGGPHRAGVQR